jgi:hypothetical protein
VTLLAAGCSPPPGEPPPGEQPAPASDSNRAMAARLAALAEEKLPGQGAFSTAQAVRYLRSIPPPPDVRSQVRQRLQLAQVLLADGQNAEAVAEIDAARALVEADRPLFRPPFFSRVLDAQAISYLRKAEVDNCVAAHNADSCLLPIRGGGVHRDPSSATRATEIYRELIALQPEDLTTRWLLNLAARTAGQYPQAVPERWRIDDAVFASEQALPRFYDVAPAAGLAVDALSGGVVTEDLTGDGLLDVMVSSWLLSDPLRFFVNRGDGSFEQRTAEAGLEGLNGGLNLVHADYDNDGFADVLVLRGAWLGRGGRHPNSLLRNRGDGTFEDVTEAAGLLDFHPTQTAAWADYDGDGWLDLFVGNESTPGETHRCRLFRNRGDGTFADVAPALGLDVAGMVKAAVWGDYDNDGRPDLFLSILGERNRLFRNQGSGGAAVWSFQDVTAEAGVGEPRASFPAWFFDYDNDGWLDLFVAGYGEDYLSAGVEAVAADYLGLPFTSARPKLYRNHGDGSFEDVTAAAGLDHPYYAMGSNFGDLDNDGFLDIYLGTGAPDFRALMPNRMLRNDGGRRFVDVTAAGGFGHLQKGHAIAFADLDNDGDQDVYAVMGGAYPGDVYPNALFENPLVPAAGGGWLGLELEGTESNRSAIGARLRLTVETASGRRQIYSTVATGGSFGSSPLRRELGLGDAEQVTELEVRWPSGTVQRFRDLATGQRYRLREGDPAPRPVAPPSFQLGGKLGAAAAPAHDMPPR